MAVNIGFDGHVLTGRFQGTRTTLSSLLRAIGPKVGDRRIVIYSDDPATARAMLGSDEFEYEALDHVGSVKRLLLTLPNLFRKHGIDIGVFQYVIPFWGKSIVFIHDILPVTHPHLFPVKMRVKTNLFFRWSIYRAKLVITVSNYTKSEVMRVFDVPHHRIRTVRNGPSFPDYVYQTPCLATSPSYILAVGRIETRKNIPLLVQAFAKAQIEGVRLIVVGSFDLNFDYKIPDGYPVEIRSGVSDDELVGLYRGASLFVYPSQAEGFGVPLLDAILFGIPTISSDQTAMTEVGADLVTYFNPNDLDSTEVLSNLITGHFSGRRIVSPSPEQRKKHAVLFSWDSAADTFLNAVDEIS